LGSSFSEIVEIFLGEDSDVEQVARISKYILVFTYASLLTQLYFFYVLHCLVYLYMLDIVPRLVLIQKSY